MTAAEAAERMKDATRLTDSCDVLSKDDYPLIRFRPGAMSLLWGDETWESFHERFLTAFKELVAEYRPNMPRNDSRHPEARAEHK